ncbi:MAG TPA: pyridoxamine 5'-phosphate oxidase family protein [Candidatus Omnitrophota bacterium]|nr:pyridoxamine 5'-phosphate oxidase family protein [Candidatus Omnitrophota bacterium]
MDSLANDQAQSPINNRHALRLVARACRKAALSTIMADGSGAPYASLVTVAFDHDLSPILLLSGLADHTRNIMAQPMVSLLLDGTDGHPNPQTGPRVTLMGVAERSDDDRLKRRFLARHPGAAQYAGFGDFGFWRVRPQRAHFVGGFGRAVWFDAPFGLDEALCAEMIEAEAALLDGVVAAADADGIDLSQPDGALRIPFPTPMDSGAELKAAVAATTGGVKR